MKVYNTIQKSDEWHHLRKGKITGTTLKAIMGTPKAKQDAIYEIVAERLTKGVESEGDYENSIDRGNRLEPDALSMFELETNRKVIRVGFCEDDTNPMIANSPDGLIEDHEDEAVEAKCPGGKNYVKMWLTNVVPDEYEWQVVQYFVVNERLQKLHFIGYNPDITIHPLHIIVITRESIKKQIEEARLAQETFLTQVDDILKNIIKL